ncbi:hypothetical protein D3C84_1226800 [compost metagenome]
MDELASSFWGPSEGMMVITFTAITMIRSASANPSNAPLQRLMALRPGVLARIFNALPIITSASLTPKNRSAKAIAFRI